jgi:hypothetical protein
MNMIMNYGLKRIWKEGVVAYFKELPQCLRERTEENCAICEASALEGSRNVLDIRSGNPTQ